MEKVGKYTISESFMEKGRRWCIAECDKGHIRKVRMDSLKSRPEVCFLCDRSNPMYKTAEYNSWDSMVQRTTNPNNSAYDRYGGAGIACCEEWRKPGGVGFKSFVSHIGLMPESGMSLDRWPNKYGNYEPGNVRWATDSQQSYNQKRLDDNTSGRTGVSKSSYGVGWTATICYNNERIYLGYSLDFDEAVKLREDAELKYFGETKE